MGVVIKVASSTAIGVASGAVIRITGSTAVGIAGGISGIANSGVKAVAKERVEAVSTVYY